MKRSTLTTLLLATSFSIAATLAQAQPTYRLTLIRPGAAAMHAVLNDRGQVAGFFLGEYSHSRAFRWKNGNWTVLESLTSDTEQAAQAVGINEFGELVGISDTADGGSYLPVGWHYNHLYELAIPPGDFVTTGPADINERFEIVGAAYPSSFESQAYVQRGPHGAAELLDVPPDTQTSLARRINRFSTITGSSRDVNYVSHALLWHDDTVQDLGTFGPTTPGNGAEARDLNDHTEVVGAVFDGIARHGFLWKDGAMTQLPALATGDDVEATGINNRHVIIGKSTNPGTQVSLATYWAPNGTLYDLNTLVAADDPLKSQVRLSEGIDINNLGWIIARGYPADNQWGAPDLYLLKPVH
jgi:uncharacterized membrane protein